MLEEVAAAHLNEGCFPTLPVAFCCRSLQIATRRVIASNDANSGRTPNLARQPARPARARSCTAPHAAASIENDSGDTA